MLLFFIVMWFIATFCDKPKIATTCRNLILVIIILYAIVFTCVFLTIGGDMSNIQNLS